MAQIGVHRLSRVEHRLPSYVVRKNPLAGEFLTFQSQNNEYQLLTYS